MWKIKIRTILKKQMDIQFPNHTKGDTLSSRDINLGLILRDRQLKCTV
jgi:hypothetical protein